MASGSSRRRRGPLDGVSVLEFAQVMAIPTCGLLLADLGATVTKIEPPRGDAFRLHLRTHVPGEGRGFAIFNRGKRSLCLDLAAPGARDVVDRLVGQADVVLVSMKASDLPRYGLTWERLRQVNPRLVYLDNTPYGPLGPLSEDGGYDVVVQGMSGAAAISAAPQGDAPRLIRPAHADMGTGFLAAFGVVTALLDRERSGEGQRVRTSLLSTAIAQAANLLHRFDDLDAELWPEFNRALAEARDRGASFDEQQRLYYRAFAAQGQGNVYFRHYRTGDGFLSVGCLSPGLNERFRSVTGLEDPRRSPAFEPSSPAGQDALEAFVREAEALFRTRTTSEWIDALRAGGVPCGPLNFPTEVFDDPQVVANEYMLEIEHPALGSYHTFATPVRLEGSPSAPPRPSPALGADTDDVLRGAGFDASEIAALREAGVVGPSG